MEKRRTIEDVVKELADVLELLGVRYAIVGGVAATSWGNIRTTLDVDVVIDLKDKDVPGLVKALTEREFTVTESEILSALREKSHFTVFDGRSIFRIDAKGAYGSRERETLRSRRKILVDKTVCYLASPEDMIANKLLSGTLQDVRDAEGIYARQLQHLDIASLKAAARRLGVSTELTKMQRSVRKRIDDLPHK